MEDLGVFFLKLKSYHSCILYSFIYTFTQIFIDWLYLCVRWFTGDKIQVRRRCCTERGSALLWRRDAEAPSCQRTATHLPAQSSRVHASPPLHKAISSFSAPAPSRAGPHHPNSSARPTRPSVPWPSLIRPVLPSLSSLPVPYPEVLTHLPTARQCHPQLLLSSRFTSEGKPPLESGSDNLECEFPAP